MSEAVPKRARIQPSKVRENLRTRILGQAGLYFRQLTSTNDIAKDLAVSGAGEGTLVAAETQTAGKGRFKRRWMSPANGLWFSVILKPVVQPKHAPKITLLASVVIAKTIKRLYGLNTEIKWPNDVLIEGKKVAGVLTEGQISGKTLDFAILGIGINANFSLEAFPTHLMEAATTLKEELGRETERETLLSEVLNEIESYYESLQQGRFEIILDDWRRLAGFLGSHVKVRSDKEKIEGWAVDVDEDGALVLRLRDSTLRRITSGDLVKIVRRGNRNTLMSNQA